MDRFRFKLFIKKSKANNDKFNKNLMKFLINNVKEIVQSNVFIKIILVSESNMKSVKALGVTSTPCLINSYSKTVGVNEIIKTLIDICENDNYSIDKKNQSKERNEIVENSGDDVKDMLMNIISAEDEEDEEDIDKRDLRKKMEERLGNNTKVEYQSGRTNQNARDMFSKLKQDNQPSHESIDLSMNNSDMMVSNGDKVEMDAMTAYWQNQEETLM